MTATFVEHFGTFTQLPDFLHRLKLSPAAKHTYAILAGFQALAGEAYICRAKIKEKLGLALTTISSAVTELEKNGLVKRTGEYKHSSYPIVQVFCGPEAGVSKRQLQSKQELTEVLANANLQLEKNEIKKKQTVQNVCSENFFIQEKENLIETLRDLGIGKNTAKDFITRYGLERVTYQAEHLEDLLRRGDDIKNPAGWLQKAISKKYQKPKERVTPEPSVEDDNRKQAYHLFQQAEQEYRSNDIVKAQELAERSNAIFPSSDAKKMLAEIEAKHQRQKRREEVLKSVPPEVFAQVLERKREEQKSVLMKFGIRKLSRIAEEAAYEATIDEVMVGR